MGGLKALPVYHYDTDENNHKYLGKFASRVEVFTMYFQGKKGRLFLDDRGYKRLPDGTYITETRCGREGLKKLVRLSEDPSVYERSDDKEIEIYNYFGELVGTVANKRILECIIQNTTESSLRNQLFKGDIKYVEFGKLRFKYKEKTNFK